MKFNYYLRVTAVVIAAAFVAAGCSDDGEEPTPPGPPPGPETFTIDIKASNITASEAIVTYTPSDLSQTYYFDLIEKVYFDELGSDEACLQDDLDYFAMAAEDNDMTLAEILEEVLSKGVSTYTFDGLEANTAYYAYGYGLNADGTRVGTFTKVLFTTLDNPTPGDEAFTLTVSNVNAANFTLAVNANGYDGNYYVGLIDAETALGDFAGDKAAIAAAFIEMEAGYGTDFAEVDDLFVFNGNAEYDLFAGWAISAGVDYKIYAFGVSATGAVTTQIAEQSVSVPAATMTSETIAVAVAEITNEGAVVTMTPSDKHLPYFCDCLPVAELEGMTDAQIIEYVAEYYGENIFYAMAIGDFEYDGTGYLESGTEYYAVAFGCAIDLDGTVAATTAVTKEVFKTGGAAPATVSKTFDTYRYGTPLMVPAQGRRIVSERKMLRPIDGVIYHSELSAVKHVGKSRRAR